MGECNQWSAKLHSRDRKICARCQKRLQSGVQPILAHSCAGNRCPLPLSGQRAQISSVPALSAVPFSASCALNESLPGHSRTKCAGRVGIPASVCVQLLTPCPHSLSHIHGYMRIRKRWASAPACTGPDESGEHTRIGEAACVRKNSGKQQQNLCARSQRTRR